MKTYDEISKRVLERRDEYITEQKGKRKKITQITSAIGCFVLVVGIGFGMNMDKWVQTQVIDPYDLGGAVFPTATLTINQGNSTEILTTTSPETTLPAIDSSENWTTAPTTTAPTISIPQITLNSQGPAGVLTTDPGYNYPNEPTAGDITVQSTAPVVPSQKGVFTFTVYGFKSFRNFA